MSSQTTNISIRMDADLKKQADELFSDLGLNMTTAMNMFVRQAVRKQGIPFDVTRDVPNAETIEAMKESIALSKDSSVKKYSDVDELFKDLDE